MQIDPTITIKFCDSGSMPLTAANTWHYPHQKCSHHFQMSLTVTQNCPSMSKLSLNIDSVTKPSSVRAEAHTQKSCKEISTKISSEMLTCWGVNTKTCSEALNLKIWLTFIFKSFFQLKIVPLPGELMFVGIWHNPTKTWELLTEWDLVTQWLSSMDYQIINFQLPDAIYSPL